MNTDERVAQHRQHSVERIPRKGVFGGVHPRLQNHPDRATVATPPLERTLAPVIPGRPALTGATAARHPGTWTRPRHHQHTAVGAVLKGG